MSNTVYNFNEFLLTEGVQSDIHEYNKLANEPTARELREVGAIDPLPEPLHYRNLKLINSLADEAKHAMDVSNYALAITFLNELEGPIEDLKSDLWKAVNAKTEELKAKQKARSEANLRDTGQVSEGNDSISFEEYWTMVRDGILDKPDFDKYVTLHKHAMCFRWLRDAVRDIWKSMETGQYNELPTRVKELEWIASEVKKAVKILASGEQSKSLELPGKSAEPTP